jgi:hypothetical protein
MTMARFESITTPIAAGQEASVILLSGREDNVVGMVKTDQAGTLHIEQSIDGGQNWDLDKSIAVVANTTTTFSEPILAPNVRIRMANTAGSGQTYLRLYARFSSVGIH